MRCQFRIIYCPDTVPLDKSTYWQVAAAKLEEMEKMASAIQAEEGLSCLSEFITDKPRRSLLCQTASECRSAVGQVSSADTREHIEAAIRAEPLAEELPPAAEATATFTEEDKPKVMVPTNRKNLRQDVGT